MPFREVPYAEDRVLAIDMLRAGYAKAFVPQAAVLHSHDYTAVQELRRCFDEWRGLREVYGWREPASPAHLTRQLRGALGEARARADPRGGLAVAPSRDAARRRAVTMLYASPARCSARGPIGSPRASRRRLSLERRAGFAPLDFDRARTTDSPIASQPQAHVTDDDITETRRAHVRDQSAGVDRATPRSTAAFRGRSAGCAGAST